MLLPYNAGDEGLDEDIIGIPTSLYEFFTYLSRLCR